MKSIELKSYYYNYYKIRKENFLKTCVIVNRSTPSLKSLQPVGAGPSSSSLPLLHKSLSWATSTQIVPLVWYRNIFFFPSFSHFEFSWLISCGLSLP